MLPHPKLNEMHNNFAEFSQYNILKKSKIIRNDSSNSDDSSNPSDLDDSSNSGDSCDW